MIDRKNIPGILLILLIFASRLSGLAQPASMPDLPYFQEIKTNINLPAEANKNVVKLLSVSGTKVAITSNGICKYRDGKWSSKIFGSGWKTATVDPNEKIWLASDKTIQEENSAAGITLPDFAQNDTILSLRWENTQNLLVGTTNGLLSYSGKWEAVPCTKGKRINAIAIDAKNDLWLATTDGLLRRMAGKWINMDDNLMAYGLKRTYFALESRLESEELLFGGLFAVGCLAENGNHWILRGADGLPYGPITTIKTFGNDLWLGTPKGAIKKDDSWHYYCGKRWLPNDRVNDILLLDEHTVWVATPEGISQIQEVEMTLDQKAAEFEKIIQLRHNRLGLINRSKLKVAGDLSTSRTENEDNDGLWTSNYLAAECFRYAVTKSEEAKALATRTYEALERLETVTGISGYPARTYAQATDSVVQSRSPHPKHWHFSPDGKWQWLDDTSSDEIVGHLFAISLFYDLVADESQKTEIRKLIGRIMDHIIGNNFHLIDADGKSTRWGIWNPDSLNRSDNWSYERGLNSLQILSHLKTTVYITGNTKYDEVYRFLIEKHGYAENVRQVKKFEPFENSHSDDILTYLPYYNLIRFAPNDRWLPLYKESLERSWKASRIDRMPAWNIISSASLKKDCDLKIALEELQYYPMDLINWTMENSHRWDLQHDQMLSRSKAPQATKPIPTPESGISRWNTNPRQFNSGAAGMQEEDGTLFLFAYWMGRYHQFFRKEN